jgi:hypothetical protein
LRGPCAPGSTQLQDLAIRDCWVLQGLALYSSRGWTIVRLQCAMDLQWRAVAPPGTRGGIAAGRGPGIGREPSQPRRPGGCDGADEPGNGGLDMAERQSADPGSGVPASNLGRAATLNSSAIAAELRKLEQDRCDEAHDGVLVGEDADNVQCVRRPSAGSSVCCVSRPQRLGKAASGICAQPLTRIMR